MPISNHELEEHRRAFNEFSHLVVFAAAHVALTLGCLALAFIGHSYWFALSTWIVGSLALIVGVVAHSSGQSHG